jgi:hypothetical protein
LVEIKMAVEAKAHRGDISKKMQKERVVPPRWGFLKKGGSVYQNIAPKGALDIDFKMISAKLP